MRRSRRTAEVVTGAAPGQLEGSPPMFHGLLFGGHLWTGFDLPPGGLFLLGFNRFGFKAASHAFIVSGELSRDPSLGWLGTP